MTDVNGKLVAAKAREMNKVARLSENRSFLFSRQTCALSVSCISFAFELCGVAGKVFYSGQLHNRLRKFLTNCKLSHLKKVEEKELIGIMSIRRSESVQG